MDSTNIERLLETLIDEIREMKEEVRCINEELNWWSKDKPSLAKYLLQSLENIERK
jgi:hypothetical protein